MNRECDMLIGAFKILADAADPRLTLEQKRDVYVPIERRIDTLLAAYDQALTDPQTKIPSYLMACIEVLR